MCHLSHFMCHVSRFTCHMSCITTTTKNQKNGPSGEAIWWRVCYQLGYPVEFSSLQFVTTLWSSHKSSGKGNLFQYSWFLNKYLLEFILYMSGPENIRHFFAQPFQLQFNSQQLVTTLLSAHIWSGKWKPFFFYKPHGTRV